MWTLSLLILSSVFERTALVASKRTQCLLMSIANDEKGVIHTEAGNRMPAWTPEHLGFSSFSPKARASVSSPGCQKQEVKGYHGEKTFKMCLPRWLCLANWFLLDMGNKEGITAGMVLC